MTDIYWPHDPNNTTHPEHESPKPKRLQRKPVLKPTKPKQLNLTFCYMGLEKGNPGTILNTKSQAVPTPLLLLKDGTYTITYITRT